MFFISPLIFVIGFFGGRISWSAFGLVYQGYSPIHPIVIWCVIIMTLAASVACGILWGKDWAIKIGIIYCYLALVTNVLAHVIRFRNGAFMLSFEFVFLIPFLVVLYQKRKAWMKFSLDSPRVEQVYGTNQ